jgi:hypothetical protein
MGVWLMGAVSAAIVAWQDFSTIDRLLKAPPHPRFAADAEKLGYGETRDLLRYLSSELNRLFFQAWNFLQLPLGTLAFWLAVKARDPGKAKWGILAMLGIVVFLTLLITPQIVSVGRALDFVPRVPPPDGLRTFGLLHATYTVFDAMLVILGVIVTIWLTKGKA